MLQCLRVNPEAMSPLTEGRGLKLQTASSKSRSAVVAPHGGAWIETCPHCTTVGGGCVAPHGGAWIETDRSRRAIVRRGVAPHGGAWIETACGILPTEGGESPLTEGRGLKPALPTVCRPCEWSPLTEGRGLKPRNPIRQSVLPVAPHGGAWIETITIV